MNNADKSNNKTMNAEFKGTKGKFETIYTRLSDFTLSTVISGESIIAHINAENVSPEECKANGELFADAGNTIQSCGLLPSELLKQRDGLRAKLRECVEAIEWYMDNCNPQNDDYEIHFNYGANIVSSSNELLESTEV